jgi:phospholipase C
VSGTARRYGMDPVAVLSEVRTRQQAIDFFKRRPSR